MKKLYHNKLLLVVIFLVGLIYGSHHFFMAKDIDPSQGEYYPYSLVNLPDDTFCYAPRANAVFFGDYTVGDMSLVEYQNMPGVLPLLNPLLIGIPAKILGSLKSAFIITDIIFPIIIFYLVYLILLSIFKHEKLSIIGSFIFILAPRIALYIPPYSFSKLVDFFTELMPIFSDSSYLYFNRVEYPQVTYIFYLLALYFIIKSFQSSKRNNVIMAGLFFGLLFYTYLYDWALLLVAFSLIFLFFIYTKRYDLARRVIWILIIGSIVSIPYWLNYFTLSGLEYYNDVLLRFGKIELRAPYWSVVWKSYFRNILLAGLIWYFWLAKNKVLSAYIISLLFAYFIALNVHVITGFNIQPDHWYRTQFFPVFLSVFMIGYGAYLKYYNDKQSKLVFKIVGISLLVILSVSHLVNQYNFSQKYKQDFVLTNENRSLIDWLNQNTERHSVVGTLSPKINTLFLLHTHNKIFISSAYTTIAPTEELWNRLIIMSKVFGLNIEEFKQNTLKNKVYLFSVQYMIGDFFKEALITVPLDILDNKAKEYQASNLSDFTKTMDYKLDYIYYDYTNQFFGVDPQEVWPELEQVFDNGQALIYRIPLY